MRKFLLSAFICFLFFCVSAGENLIKNGSFEGAGSFADWGAYATHSSFKCSDWIFYNSSDGGKTKNGATAGLTRPSSTWTAMTKDQIGDFAVFIQSSSTADSSTSVYVEQQIGEIPLGLYRVSFKPKIVS
jgi:hypothetical protein